VTKETCGDRIRGVRIALKMTQEAACDKMFAERGVAVTTNTWSRIENDRANPMSSTLEAIADTLGVSMDWLQKGKLCRLAGRRNWRVGLN